jgi:hypothetical protein
MSTVTESSISVSVMLEVHGSKDCSVKSWVQEQYSGVSSNMQTVKTKLLKAKPGK